MNTLERLKAITKIMPDAKVEVINGEHIVWKDERPEPFEYEIEEAHKQILMDKIKDYLIDKVMEEADRQTDMLELYISDNLENKNLLKRYKVKEKIAREAVENNDYSKLVRAARIESSLQGVEITPEQLTKKIIEMADNYNSLYEEYVMLIEDYRVGIKNFIKNINDYRDIELVDYVLFKSKNFTSATRPDEVNSLVFGLLNRTLNPSLDGFASELVNGLK